MSQDLGNSTEKGLHKAVKARVYLTNRTWLLKISKKDALWLNLEPGEDLTINFRKREQP